MKFFRVMIVLALLGPAVWAGVLTKTYEASDGRLYVISPGKTAGVASCDPIPGGLECSIDAEPVVAVLDGSGCQEKKGLAFCLVANKDEFVAPAGKSTLECENKNYELTDGAGGQCTENNGVDMTCEQPNSSNIASATCDGGCGVISGSGDCRPVAKPDAKR